MDWLYILFFVLTFVLIIVTVHRYWRGGATKLEDRLEKVDKRLEDSLSLLEGGLSHEEKETTG